MRLSDTSRGRGRALGVLRLRVRAGSHSSGCCPERGLSAGGRGNCLLGRAAPQRLCLEPLEVLNPADHCVHKMCFFFRTVHWVLKSVYGMERFFVLFLRIAFSVVIVFLPLMIVLG